ncbi:alpha/beta fold hydrolase [Agromyces sp. G08B096]|uniref:Alpha/beta fold hydrolase n=1 Tax=Agromyces sp. G08B096 TaxID=3156399 RepID=A0AAU7W9J8_9MICO
MPHLIVPGAELAYEAHGRASDPALLCIPAGVATMRMWDEHLAELARTHYVITYDPRGFGATTHDAAVPFANHDDALAVLDHLGVARATLIGASRGGGIAIDVALAAPERVAGLVVVGSGASGFPDVTPTGAEQRRFDELDAIDPEAEPARLVELETRFWATGPDRTDEEVDPAFLRRAHELNAPNIAHAADDGTILPLDPPATGRLAEIAVPALVLVGDLDVSVMRARAAHLVAEIPGAETASFPDAAHLPTVERPAEFRRILLTWLDEHGL